MSDWNPLANDRHRPAPTVEPPSGPGKLRQRAEEAARSLERRNPLALSPEQAQRALHELRVHQIELEMQNEELRRTQVELNVSRARYFDLYDLAPVGYLTVSEEGLILEGNLTASTLLGVARGALVKRPLTRFVLPEDQDGYNRHRNQLFATGEPQTCELRMVKEDGSPFWVVLAASVARTADGEAHGRVLLSDCTERKRAEALLREKSEELRRAFDQIKTLRGIVPICMGCKKIRDDKGFWNQVEVYVRDHTEARFSHGLCPECFKKMDPASAGDHEGCGGKVP